jgi:hypothetical protein
MDQLIQMITQRTGISEDQARQAVQMVAGFLKEKLPAPIGSQIDNVLGGSGQSAQGGTDQAKNMLGGLGGMFGNKGQE